MRGVSRSSRGGRWRRLAGIVVVVGVAAVAGASAAVEAEGDVNKYGAPRAQYSKYSHGQEDSEEEWMEKTKKGADAAARLLGEAADKHTILQDLAVQFKTDKASHGYAVIYEDQLGHIRHKPTDLLEVGVFLGASLNMWHAYVDHPDARIVGVDKFQGYLKTKPVYLEEEGTMFVAVDSVASLPLDPLVFFRAYHFGELPKGQEVYMTDQGERSDLERFTAMLHRTESSFDVIVDDGSHIMKDQQQTMGMLFPFVKPGGVYVMEDTHTSHPKHTGYGLLPDLSNNWWAVMDMWRAAGTIQSIYMTTEEERYMTRWVDKIECFLVVKGQSETCLLHKRDSIE